MANLSGKVGNQRVPANRQNRRIRLYYCTTATAVGGPGSPSTAKGKRINIDPSSGSVTLTLAEETFLVPASWIIDVGEYFLPVFAHNGTRWAVPIGVTVDYVRDAADSSETAAKAYADTLVHDTDQAGYGSSPVTLNVVTGIRNNGGVLEYKYTPIKFGDDCLGTESSWQTVGNLA